MGLDIYLEEIIPEKQEYPIILNDNTDLCKVSFFNHFKEFTYEVENEYYDFASYFESIGLNMETDIVNLTQFSSSDYFNYEDNECNCFKTSYSVLPIINKKELALSTKQIDYQRKGMNKEFYKNYLGKEIYYFWTNSQLDKIKKYCDEDEPLMNWNLKENQFIYCWY